MATFKTEIQNKRADGTYNVRIRVTHNRVIKRLSTNIYITDEDLTRSLKIKNIQVINQCNEIISKCHEICNNLGYEISALSIDELLEKLKTQLQGEERFKLDFIQYMKDKAAAMKISTGGTYLNTVNSLCRFLNRETLDIAEINVKFLQDFENFLETEPSQRGSNRKGDKKNIPLKGGRAISAYIGCIRAIHNKAKLEFNDEDNGVIRIPQSPFKKFKLKPQPQTRKRALTVSQIQKIINLPYTDNTRRNLAKDCFILSFALIGINSADMFYAEPLKNNILIYKRRKTADRRNDNAEMRVLVEDGIGLLMEKYQDSKRLFNFYKRYSDHKGFNKALNIGLLKVGEEIGEEKLEFYAARHSWATIARSAAINIDKATVSEALNHVSNTVTDIYINRDWSLIWNANKKVLALFDWSAVGYDVI